MSESPKKLLKIQVPSAEERREMNPGTSNYGGTWGPHREGQLYPWGPGKRLGEGLKQEDDLGRLELQEEDLGICFNKCSESF